VGRTLWRGHYADARLLRLPRLDFLDIQYKEKPVGFRFPRHSHSRFHEIYVIDRGGVEIDLGSGRRFRAGAGQATLFLPGQGHAVRGLPGLPTNILTVHFECSGLAGRLGGIRGLSGRAADLGPAALAHLRGLLQSLDAQGGSAGTEAALGLVNLLLMLVQGTAAAASLAPGKAGSTPVSRARAGLKPASKFVEGIDGIIQAELGSRLTLGRIASEAGVSVSQLAHQYKAETGETVQAAILRLRVEAAKALLRRDGIAVKEIAALTGFRTASALAAAFRKREGTLPLEYRRSLQF
jgi:AraC-like DNA-binding protein